uniref:Secreted protein n=1 Tax=Lepeophtheirus salmonis TaxID=72036 RepID=A0A0K2UGX8_LEPSM
MATPFNIFFRFCMPAVVSVVVKLINCENLIVQENIHNYPICLDQCEDFLVPLEPPSFHSLYQKVTRGPCKRN